MNTTLRGEGTLAVRAPSFVGLKPASALASSTARSTSGKRDSRCELVLRKALWALGLRYRVAVKTLPGKPDIVMSRHRIAIFCDGDFWHGRDLDRRLRQLGAGHNASYWVAKIRGNVERDRRHDAALRAAGWIVLRFWERDILRASVEIARKVLEIVERVQESARHASAGRARPRRVAGRRARGVTESL